MTDATYPNTTTTATLGLCWGSVPRGTLLDIARVASAHGLKTLSVGVAHHVDELASGTTDREIRRVMDDLGVRVSIIDPLISALPGTPRAEHVPSGARRSFELTEDDCCRSAEALGASTINLAHFMGMQIGVPALQDAVGSIADRLHARGFATTLEFLPGTGVPDVVTATKIVEAAPRATIMFDTWHFARSNGTLEDLDRLPAGSVGSVQLSDRVNPPAGYTELPMSGRRAPGEGELPLPEILAKVLAGSPGLDVCIEVFSDELAAVGWDEAGRRMADGGRAVLAATQSLLDAG